MMASVETQSIRTSTTESVRSFSPDDDTLSTIEETFEYSHEYLTSTPCIREEPCLLFDEKHKGKNARVLKRGTLAQRRKKGCKEAVVMTNRPLRDSELFEVEIGADGDGFKGVKAMLGGKGGSIRIGVTAHCPSDLWHSFPQSMKRMSSGTWMMKGDEIMANGETILTLHSKNSLKNLSSGDKLGLMRAPEFGGSLIIFVNASPVGIVATGVPDDVYAFVELYGDCDRVNITGNSSIDEECLPEQIQTMRATVRSKDCEIKRLRKKLSEKELEVSKLNRQIEVLNRPPTPPSLSKSKKISSSSMFSRLESLKQQQNETDGDTLSLKSDTPPRRRKRKGACCTIM